MIDQPPIPSRFVDAMMDARAVKHNRGRTTIVHREQIVKKADYVWAFDAAGMGGMDQRVRAIVQGARNTTLAVGVRFNVVRQASW